MVLNHIIQWVPYRKRKSGPTQCLNCGMFGHGMATCGRKTICLLCGGNHKSKDCIFINDTNDQRVFKCNNCKINNLPYNHKANDDNCPMRTKYIEIRAAGNRGVNRPVATRTQQVLNINADAMFPPLHTQATSSAQPFKHSYANIASNQNKQNAPAPAQPNDGNDLFTFAEISTIMLNCVNELTNCKTKIDQIRVIANLFNYAFK